jgi:hypothetical protein
MHCILVYAEGPGGQYCSIQNFMLPSSFAIMGFRVWSWTKAILCSLITNMLPIFISFTMTNVPLAANYGLVVI